MKANGLRPLRCSTAWWLWQRENVHWQIEVSPRILTLTFADYMLASGQTPQKQGLGGVLACLSLECHWDTFFVGAWEKVCTPPLNQVSNKPQVRERGRSKHHWLQTISFILSFVGEEKKNESNIHPPSSGPFWSTQLSFLSRQHLAYCESCSGNGILDEHLWSAFKFMHSKAWLCKQFHVCLEFL